MMNTTNFECKLHIRYFPSIVSFNLHISSVNADHNISILQIRNRKLRKTKEIGKMAMGRAGIKTPVYLEQEP